MQNLDRPYLTRDLYLAAYLCTRGMTLLDVTPIADGEPRKFIFVDSQARDDLVEDWVSGSGDATVCRTYATKIRMVKSVLYGDKK
jgi:hypothetical protein